MKADVVMLIVVATTLGVGVIIWADIDSILLGYKDADATADLNDTVDAVSENTWSGFNLNTILPIILAAIVVLGAVQYLG